MRGIPNVAGPTMVALSVFALGTIALLGAKPATVGHVATATAPACTAQSLDGSWSNVHPQTGDLTRLEINVSCEKAVFTPNAVDAETNAMEVSAWAKCEPNDCRWGRAVAVPSTHSPTGAGLVEANSAIALSRKVTETVTARFEQGSASRILTLRQIGDALEVEVTTDFKSPNRIDYVARERFVRSAR
jgi:hypothetical protein